MAKKHKHPININIPMDLNLEVEKILLKNKIDNPGGSNNKKDLIVDLLIQGVRAWRKKIKFFNR